MPDTYNPPDPLVASFFVAKTAQSAVIGGGGGTPPPTTGQIWPRGSRA